MLKTPGLPIWVTIFALIVFALACVLGVMALAGSGADPNMTVSWGGRTLGLGLAAGLAVALKSPAAYIVAFAGGLAREAGDLLAHLAAPESSIGVLVGIVVFFVAGVLGIIAALKARNQQI